MKLVKRTGSHSHLKLAALTISIVLLHACSSQTKQAQQDSKQTDDAVQQLSQPASGALHSEPIAAELVSQDVASHAKLRPLPEAIMAKQHLAVMPSVHPVQGKPMDGEHYAHYQEQRVFNVVDQPVSTFSVDVDTGSYTNVRRMLNQGYLPPADAVRVEEFINYFDYQYPQQSAQAPFSVNTELMVSPFDANKRLLRIGLQGKVDHQPIVGRNLVFLLDVSGSMNQASKLPLLKKALSLLLSRLGSNDKVAIVVYAGAAGVVLEPTSGDQRGKIERALDKLKAGGSTNGGQGIELAYKLAQQSFIKQGVNRVILATDGDFNVGTVDHQQLLDLIARQRQQGIALTTLGFGQGNYNDHLMEQLANTGNGNYAYIDNINEARKVLVDEFSASMQIIAKDVKIQVEFNSHRVSEYRLIGYENRLLNREDFNNDKVDAGEIGAGHRVTALYELTLVGGKGQLYDPLRYQQVQLNPADKRNELAEVKLRYKQPQQDSSRKIAHIVQAESALPVASASADSRFAAAVAGFAQLLKRSQYTQGIHYQDLIDLANASKGADSYGYRAELVQLIRTAQALTRSQHGDEVENRLADQSVAAARLRLGYGK